MPDRVCDGKFSLDNTLRWSQISIALSYNAREPFVPPFVLSPRSHNIRRSLVDRLQRDSIEKHSCGDLMRLARPALRRNLVHKSDSRPIYSSILTNHQQ